MADESQANPRRKIRDDSVIEGEPFGELFPNAKPQVTGHEKRMLQRTVTHPSVYLWLCCEGWMKFGPYEWLRFDDDKQAILGPDGEEVAKKTGGQWRVPGEKWQGWGFSNPTITTSAVHPHPKSGDLP